MNILQGVKPSPQPTPLQPQKQGSTKFIIKSKPSLAKTQQPDSISAPPPSCPSLYASNQDIHQLITYIVTKSKRLEELLDSKDIDQGVFHQNYLFNNACLRTYLKAVLDRLFAERRLGKALKGINKGILTEIQNCIWGSIEREVSLYQLDEMYQNQKTSLQSQLSTRRQEIQKQLEQLNRAVQQSLEAQIS